jgi:deazaflavin-dependent oxidoreductase (nitroreductase family)
MAQSDKAKDHVRRYKTSGGADGHMWDQLGAPGTYSCLLLTTVGRKSQAPRTTPLVYGRDGDNYLVIGSKGGRPTHPAWYLNLVANPGVELQIGARIIEATAHTAIGDERAKLWDRMRGVYPLYDEYEARIGDAREIPLVVFVPD